MSLKRTPKSCTTRKSSSASSSSIEDTVIYGSTLSQYNHDDSGNDDYDNDQDENRLTSKAGVRPHRTDPLQGKSLFRLVTEGTSPIRPYQSPALNKTKTPIRRSKRKNIIGSSSLKKKNNLSSSSSSSSPSPNPNRHLYGTSLFKFVTGKSPDRPRRNDPPSPLLENRKPVQNRLFKGSSKTAKTKTKTKTRNQ